VSPGPDQIKSRRFHFIAHSSHLLIEIGFFLRSHRGSGFFAQRTGGGEQLQGAVRLILLERNEPETFQLMRDRPVLPHIPEGQDGLAVIIQRVRMVSDAAFQVRQVAFLEDDIERCADDLENITVISL
jgi:hypothetical protein